MWDRGSLSHHPSRGAGFPGSCSLRRAQIQQRPHSQQRAPWPSCPGCVCSLSGRSRVQVRQYPMAQLMTMAGTSGAPLSVLLVPRQSMAGLHPTAEQELMVLVVLSLVGQPWLGSWLLLPFSRDILSSPPPLFSRAAL